MGFFDDIFGGFFDFNGDGKTTWDEEWIAYKILEDIDKEDEPDNDYHSSGIFHSHTSFHTTRTDDSDSFDDTDVIDTEDDSWRIWCEDGSEYNVSPEDFGTEDEYNEALEEAKVAWRENYQDDNVAISPDDYETEDEYQDALQEETDACISDTISIPIKLSFTVECPVLDKLDAIKETDYPNKRQYNAAYTLANELIFYCDKEQEELAKEKCHFILEKSATIIAANYLTVDDGFLFAQAVKEHFTLPIEIKDEDEESNLYFTELIKKIAKKDIPLSIKIWDWCVKEFLPYAKYAPFANETLTSGMIDDLYEFSDKFRLSLVCYFCKHSDFCNRIILNAPKLAGDVDELIYIALSNRLMDTAKLMFKNAIKKVKTDKDRIIRFVNSVISLCENGEELESMEAFQNNLFPLVVDFIEQDDISDCQTRMKDYIEETERDCEKYAFSRRNVWRRTVPDGKKFRLNVLDYDSEQEYMEALSEAKYGWREYYDKENCYGLEPTDFETEQELKAAIKAIRTKSQSDHTEAKSKNNEAISDSSDTGTDNNTYIYCGVVFSNNGQIYSYRTDDATLTTGDTVIVPVGQDMREKEARIVFVGQFTGKAVPFPVAKTRFIIRKSEGNSDGK